MANNKIGIDFHGVITADPELFKTFCQTIRKQGIKVYIISGGPFADVKSCLTKHGIEYDVIWAIYDYYEQKGTVKRFSDGTFQVPTKLWNQAKAEYCQKEGITFHIDDSPIYGRYFTTPYCRYDINADSCTLNTISFSFKDPAAAAKQIAAFIKG